MANEKRLIEVESAWEKAQKIFSDSALLLAIRVALDKAPAVEVVHGRWVNNKNDYPECDKCGYMPQYDPMIDDIWYSPYCPKCGAKMESGEKYA